MKREGQRALLRAMGAGFATGLRSMTGPAATIVAGGNRFAPLAVAMALGEFVVDKLPGIPARVQPPGLAFRLLAGGFSGGVIARRADVAVPLGVLAGAIGALAGAYGGYRLRAYLTVGRGWPALPVALAEDAAAVGIARLATAVG
jgi:uncharacterized membrane protein